MMERPFAGKMVFRLCVVVLGITVGVGALALSAAEDLSLVDGLWLCFTVITTIGFGEGPVTGAGRLIAAGCFFAAASCWFGLISVSVEVGMARYQRTALISQALAPLPHRSGPRLFDRN